MWKKFINPTTKVSYVKSESTNLNRTLDTADTAAAHSTIYHKKYFMVIDFEANCSSNGSRDHEIIEFPAILVNTNRQISEKNERSFNAPFEMSSILTNWIGVENVNSTEKGTFSVAFSVSILSFYLLLCHYLEQYLEPLKSINLKYYPVNDQLKIILPTDMMHMSHIKYIDIQKIVIKHKFEKSRDEVRKSLVRPLYAKIAEFIAVNRENFRSNPSNETLIDVAKKWLNMGLPRFDKPKKYKPSLLWIYSKQTQQEMFTMALIMHRMKIYKDMRFMIFEHIAKLANY